MESCVQIGIHMCIYTFMKLSIKHQQLPSVRMIKDFILLHDYDVSKLYICFLITAKTDRKYLTTFDSSVFKSIPFHT